MPVVAQGCDGTVSCEAGQMVVDALAITLRQFAMVMAFAGPAQLNRLRVDPSQVVLDPTKRYYISVLPGDAAHVHSRQYQAELSPATPNGHAMGGAPIAVGQLSVTCHGANSSSTRQTLGVRL